MKRVIATWIAVGAISAGCGGGGAKVAPKPKAPSSGALFRANEVIAYEIKDGQGKVVGTSHSTFLSSSDGNRRVRTRVSVGTSGAEHITTFRNDMSPVFYNRITTQAGKYSLKFAGEDVDVITTSGARKARGQAAKVVLLPADDLMMLALALQTEKLEPGAAIKMDVYSADKLDSSPWNVTAYADPSGDLVVDLPKGKAIVGSNGRVRRFERDGLVFEPKNPPGNPPKVVYRPPVEYKRPDGARWVDKPLTVRRNDGTLSGVLSVPRERSQWKGQKAPLVIFISDKGKQDRHGFVDGLDLGTWQIMDHLADHGIAVVRIDDRGTGGTKATVPGADRAWVVAADDAMAIQKEVAKEAEIDAEKTFVMGHGAGGVAAAVVAARNSAFGLIMVATPFGKFGDLDLGVTLAQVDLPVASFVGLKDFEVDWRKDSKAIMDALKKGPSRRKSKQFAYDRVDHLMKEEPLTSSVERYADRSRHMDQRFLDDLVGWITKQAK